MLVSVLRCLASPRQCLAGWAIRSVHWWAVCCLVSWRPLTAGYISSQYKDAVAFILIILLLFFMPQGLFGSKHAERV
jgi:branched-subunit amino acid ABC-type transport system permease component